MTLIDLIKLAASNLWRRRMRTALTVLGVIIGTMCIIVMITLGISNIEQTEQTYGSQDLDIVTVSSGGGYGPMMAEGSSDSKPLNDSTIAQFGKIEGVEVASPVYNLNVFVKIGQYESELYVYAMDPRVMGTKDLYGGRAYTAGSDMPEILLGDELLRNFRDPKRPNEDFWGDSYYMFGNEQEEEEYELPGPELDWLNLPVKMTFGGDPSWAAEFGDENSPVGKTYRGAFCGIAKSGKYTFESDSYMSLELARKMIKENRKLAEQYNLKEDEYNEIRIKAESKDDVERIIERVRELGYTPYSNMESIKMWQDELRKQQSQLLLIAGITLLVSAIGIANTMLTTILERRSEIGVMKVVGMKIRSINFLFLTEASIIGGVGGLIGTALSYIAVYVLNNSVGMGDEPGMVFGLYLGENPHLSIPIWLVLLAVGIAMATGLLSGIYPAYKATKMSPLEAIRST